MKIEFAKVHPSAVTPSYAKPGDAGLDLTAVGRTETQAYTEYDTGIAVAIPTGYAGLLFARSSVTAKDLMLKNAVGVIDSTYRGTIKLRFQRVSPANGVYQNEYMPGDRVGQLVVLPVPQVELTEVAELGATARGDGGFGHTGS